MSRTTSRELREITERLKAMTGPICELREIAKPIGSYTESRMDRALSCIMEAHDCFTYALGNFETYASPDERDAAAKKLLAAMELPIKPPVAGYIVTLETEHFVFEADGVTEEEANEAMGRLLNIHRDQYYLSDEWWTDYDFSTRKFVPGVATRNGDIPL